MKETSDIMFSLIRYELTGKAPKLPSSDMLDALYRLSKSHDLAHMVGNSLEKNHFELPDELSKKFSKQQFTAVFRYEQSRYELDSIKELFESEKIPFIPLKGSVIRDLYPEPWMRTSCDIDILVRESELKRAINALAEKLGYEVGQRGSHDVGLVSPGGTHIELHFELIEENFLSQNVESILKTVWNHAHPANNGYLNILSDEFFMFYHIAHMAKHFSVGGCGIRPFLDLFILEKSDSFDTSSTELLKESGLIDFYNASKALSEVWFSEKTHDSITPKMENYLILGGVYGTTENRVAAGKEKSGGRFAYIMSRLFLPYGVMKNQYPILRKLPILLPFFYVKRWIKPLFDGRFKKTAKELKLSSKKSTDTDFSELMKKLGI